MITTANINQYIPDDSMDISELMKEDFTSDIENKTTHSISKEIFDIVVSLYTSDVHSENISNICSKLSQYRFIDEICYVGLGKYVRWIRKTSPNKLTNGGIVINIKFGDNGALITVKCGRNRIFQYIFDECITFQKLSYEELMILIAQESLISQISTV
jgi:hypothetical protein